MAVSKPVVCVVTSTRAEYGILSSLIRGIQKSSKLKLLLAVTGTHLSREFGDTYRFIEADKLPIAVKIRIQSPGNDPSAIGKTSANALGKFTEWFSKVKPQAVVVLGDRYEILAIAQAAALARIPVVHLHGGEITRGATDELFRHAITKLSSLHFASTAAHRQRVIQMGEHPRTVKVSGALGVETIRKLRLLTSKELEHALGIGFSKLSFLVTFHPATMEKQSPAKQFNELLRALDRFMSATIFISKANADEGGAEINRIISRYAKSRSNVVVRDSFGQLNYLSLMKHCDVVIGNSSSGIIEAPSLRTPTVNIGDRQSGRVRAKSVIDCAPAEDAIYQSIQKALRIRSPRIFANPYQKRDSMKIILRELERADFDLLLPKNFYDLR